MPTETIDAAGDRQTIYRLTTGETFAGTISAMDDVDWIAVHLTAGESYVFTLDEAQPLNAMEARFYLMRPDVTTTATSLSGGGNSMDFTPTRDGLYYLGIESDFATGAYGISMATDVPATIDTTAVVAPGQPYEGSFDFAGDEDWVAVDLAYGYTYVIRATGIGSPDPETLTLYSGQFSQAAYMDPYNEAPNDRQLVYTVAGIAGRHWIGVSDMMYQGSGGYRLEVSLDTPDSQATPHLLQDGAPVTDSLDYNADSDWVELGLDRYQIAAIGFSRAATGGAVTLSALEAGDSYDAVSTTTTGTGATLLTARLSDHAMFASVTGPSDAAAGAYTLTQTTLGRIVQGAYGAAHFALPGVSADIRVDLRQFDPVLRIDGIGTLQTGSYQSLGQVIGATSGSGDDMLIGSGFGNRLLGGDGADSLYGVGGSDSLGGGAGDDSLSGGIGSDRLAGGTGHDTLEGGTGADTLFGGDGDDLVDAGDQNDWAQGGAGADTLHGGNGNDTVFGGDGDDLGNGDGDDDFLFGGAGRDSLDGGTGADSLDGWTGDDLLFGGAGNDTLTGSAGADVLAGGAGDDFLNGGFAFDTLTGGDGADRFFHAGNAGHGTDWVRDYDSASGDVLVFGGAATSAEFAVTIAAAPGRGEAALAEAFVAYLPTGQILWALEDGAEQGAILVQTGMGVFDLLA